MQNCPTCGQPIKQDVPPQIILPMHRAVTKLRRHRRVGRRFTMTGASVKRLFGISDGQLGEVPFVEVFGEKRYDKRDIVHFVQSRQVKCQSKIRF